MNKPAPGIFRRSLRELGISPSDALFVGDHPRADILGAQRAGLKAAWVDLGRTWTQPTRPDIELRSVLDLEQRVLKA